MTFGEMAEARLPALLVFATVLTGQRANSRDQRRAICRDCVV